LQIQEKGADEGDKQESYSISILCAYHFHMAGFHDKSFEHNSRIARMAFDYGDLDLTEKCYQRAINDAQALGKIEKKMRCMLELSRNVYMIWDGRHEEAKNNYQRIHEWGFCALLFAASSNL
jgi:hypothetical protein